MGPGEKDKAVTQLRIRPLERADREVWNPLWHGYLTFYQVEISADQTDLTFDRLVTPGSGLAGLVARDDEAMRGFAHWSLTPSTWEPVGTVYLEDLFVDPHARSAGVGRALIQALDQVVVSLGARGMYWHTHRDNQIARALYDRVGVLSQFVKYDRAAP